MEIFLEPIEDSIKTLPILFIAFLVMEYLKGKNLANKVLSHERLGPPIGAILGSIPQCGFSVVASQLYGMRVITMGTLLSIFMATSDEAIPILIAHPSLYKMIILLIFLKAFVGGVTGFIVDRFAKKTENDYEYIEIEDCTCSTGASLWINTLLQTLKIFAFILATNIVMTLIIEFIGEDQLKLILEQNKFIQPILAGLVGFIPNCAGSVVLTQLYVSKAITFGALFTGLSTSAGVGTFALLAYNKNKKENIKILAISYIVSMIVGYILILAS